MFRRERDRESADIGAVTAHLSAVWVGNKGSVRVVISLIHLKLHHRALDEVLWSMLVLSSTWQTPPPAYCTNCCVCSLQAPLLVFVETFAPRVDAPRGYPLGTRLLSCQLQ